MYIQSVDCHVYYEKYLFQNFHDIIHIISSLFVLNIEIYIKNIEIQIGLKQTNELIHYFHDIIHIKLI